LIETPGQPQVRVQTPGSRRQFGNPGLQTTEVGQLHLDAPLQGLPLGQGQVVQLRQTQLGLHQSLCQWLELQNSSESVGIDGQVELSAAVGQSLHSLLELHPHLSRAHVQGCPRAEGAVGSQAGIQLTTELSAYVRQQALQGQPCKTGHQAGPFKLPPVTPGA
jgi:hypothetical protein